jgi:hypothetical protein
MRNVVRFIVVGLLLAACSFAQSAGSKDLTVNVPQPPQDHLARPAEEVCPSMNTGISDGRETGRVDTAAPQSKMNVEFSIIKISPAELRINQGFTATVRLKNIGPNTLLFPWETDGESVTRIAAGGEEENYEAVDIALRLRSGTQQIAPVWLKSAGALFAHPEVKSSHIAIKPGQWVDVTMKAQVHCSEGLPCGKIIPDRHGIMTAWWYERQLTHRIHGCDENYGNFVIRELESKPLQVIVSRAQASAAN